MDRIDTASESTAVSLSPTDWLLDLGAQALASRGRGAGHEMVAQAVEKLVRGITTTLPAARPDCEELLALLAIPNPTPAQVERRATLAEQLGALLGVDSVKDTAEEMLLALWSEPGAEQLPSVDVLRTQAAVHLVGQGVDVAGDARLRRVFGQLRELEASQGAPRSPSVPADVTHDGVVAFWLVTAGAWAVEEPQTHPQQEDCRRALVELLAAAVQAGAPHQDCDELVCLLASDPTSDRARGLAVLIASVIPDAVVDRITETHLQGHGEGAEGTPEELALLAHLQAASAFNHTKH